MTKKHYCINTVLTHMKINKESSTPLYIQIREALRSAISTGTLATGDRLPAVTAMATERGVTAATIRRALSDLIAEGLIYTHVGRGTFVGTNPDRKVTGTVHASLYREESSEQAVRRLARNVQASLQEMLALAQKPSVIAFTRGVGSLDNVEKDILARMTKKALAHGEDFYWDYGDPKGLLSLRKAIANHYRQRGMEISPDQILVTNGSQQATALIAQQAAASGNRVLCETPCYTGGTNAFSAFNVPIESVLRDESGPHPDRFESEDDQDSILYLCPILHNPMGTDCIPERRNTIIGWAKRNHALILSDEVFHDLHFEENGAPLSFLRDPGPERVAVMGSLSKSFIAGLRVGWIISTEERIRTLTRIKKTMDLGCPPLIQGIAREFLEHGYDDHRKKVTALYRERRDRTLDALERHMPDGVTWTSPQGGFQLWVTLPDPYSSVALFLRGIDNGVAFLPGPLQDINNRFLSSFRLCYGSLPPEEIETGITRLAQTVTQYLSRPPSENGLAGLGDF